MAIGLKDLKKKRAANSNSSAPNSFSNGLASARTLMSRPWSRVDSEEQDESPRASSRSRKSPIGTDAVMNEDWLSLHTANLLFAELTPESLWAQAQGKLLTAERSAKSFVSRTQAALLKLSPF